MSMFMDDLDEDTFAQGWRSCARTTPTSTRPVNAIALSPLPDMLLIGRLKRKKLAMKDDISRIEALLTPDIIA